MNIKDFDTQLQASNTTKEARMILDHYLRMAGFKYYAFTYYSGHIKTGRKLFYDCVSDPLQAWHRFYLEQQYADVDRTLEENTTMDLPLYWNVQEQLRNAKNIREKRMRQEAIHFGVDKGLSIPVHGPNYDFATLTLHQFRGENSLKHYEERQYEWLNITLFFYHHIKRILRINEVPLNYHLTKREKQCLEFTAKSWRVEQIAKELKISERTVNYHLQNANKKLGTNNKYQAIYKYLQLDI